MNIVFVQVGKFGDVFCVGRNLLRLVGFLNYLLLIVYLPIPDEGLFFLFFSLTFTSLLDVSWGCEILHGAPSTKSILTNKSSIS